MIEADIKIKCNYMGFIPTIINTVDEEGNHFTIQTIAQADGRWMKERNARIHKTFTSEATRNFDEFKSKSEQYFFFGNVVVSPSCTSPKNNQAEDKHPKSP